MGGYVCLCVFKYVCANSIRYKVLRRHCTFTYLFSSRDESFSQ